MLIEEEEPLSSPRPLTFGKHRTGTSSTPEDFSAAEWRGEEEFDGLYGR